MNKKELIENIQNLESESESSNYRLGFEKAKYWCLTLASNLEESKAEKVEVPDYVAEWYEDNKDDLEFNIWDYIVDWDAREDNEFKDWMDGYNKPLQTLIRMKDGYTVNPKRWVVKRKSSIALESFISRSIDPVWTTEEPLWMTFDNKTTAEAVALLVNGNVEEVAE